MMTDPPLDLLLTKADSKYVLVVAAAKRARQLMQGAEPRIQSESRHPVTIALEELAKGEISYERTKSGIK